MERLGAVDVWEAGLEPLPGGWSGQTFLAAAGDERSVVRIYAEPSVRGELAAEVDAALQRLVRGLVPVPDVLEVRRADPTTGAPSLLVTSFVEGRSAEDLLPTLDSAGREVVGAALGRLAGTLAGMPTLRSGHFVDAELTIRSFEEGDADLPALVAARSSALVGWNAEDHEGLAEVAATAQDRLDEAGRTCLVHSDLNPKNVLVDPATLEVNALVDWEYAHSGSPYADLGNVIRFDREPLFEAAAVAGYVEQRGGTGEVVLELARCADLFALVELATRVRRTPVTDRAGAHLRAIAVTRDVHATAPHAGWTLGAGRA